MPERFGGYVGAYLNDGLHQRLLLALAEELRHALPNILAKHPLRCTLPASRALKRIILMHKRGRESER